jgi:hypothetical protein
LEQVEQVQVPRWRTNGTATSGSPSIFSNITSTGGGRGGGQLQLHKSGANWRIRWRRRMLDDLLQIRCRRNRKYSAS